MKGLVQTKVRHSGINFRKLNYWHLKLSQYQGTNVFVRLEKEKLKVYDCYGKFICTAKANVFTEKTRAGKDKCASCPYFALPEKIQSLLQTFSLLCSKQ